jgi:ribonuclease HI
MITAYFDGACEPINPGGTASYGIVVYHGKQMVWRDSKLFVPTKGREKETSNNVAEYSGFKAILEFLLQEGFQDDEICIYGDSQLVINQMFGNWRILRGFYTPVAEECKKLLEGFKHLSGKWIPREENSFADLLSKDCLKKAGVKLRIQSERRIK